jgi:hypothetical protein
MKKFYLNSSISHVMKNAIIVYAIVYMGLLIGTTASTINELLICKTPIVCKKLLYLKCV